MSASAEQFDYSHKEKWTPGTEKAFLGTGSPHDEELARLKRELAQVTKERDFLRDAAAYFANESSSGTR